MRKQLTIIAAGLGLAVGGFGLFSVSASAMSASGVAAISNVKPWCLPGYGTSGINKKLI